MAWVLKWAGGLQTRPVSAKRTWPLGGQTLLGTAVILHRGAAKPRLLGCLAATSIRLGGNGELNTTTPFGNPLPPVVHLTLTQDQLKKGRIIIVGDIHGCYDEFSELLRRCNFNKNEDNLILVGDIVNKGPYSTKVISKAQELNAWAVRGNHDDAALHWYHLWKQGEAFKWDWVRQMTPSQADYLDSLPFTLTIPHRRVLVVHAGVVPGNPLPEQNLVDLYQMRDLKKKGHSWVALELATADTTAWAKEWKGEYHIFFGHDAKRRLQFHRYATGLDSGCCYGGQLTACILPRTADVSRDSSAGATREALGAEMVSVQAKKDYREK